MLQEVSVKGKRSFVIAKRQLAVEGSSLLGRHCIEMAPVSDEKGLDGEAVGAERFKAIGEAAKCVTE